MRQRKAIDYGGDLTPRQIWATWVRETHALMTEAVTPARTRYENAPEDEAVPAQ
jgi:hypothetical protein